MRCPQVGLLYPISICDVDAEVDDHTLSFKDRRVFRCSPFREHEWRATNFLRMKRKMEAKNDGDADERAAHESEQE